MTGDLFKEKRGVVRTETKYIKRGFWSSGLQSNHSRPPAQKFSSPRIDSWSASREQIVVSDTTETAGTIGEVIGFPAAQYLTP
jgi:hypothetical protein